MFPTCLSVFFFIFHLDCEGVSDGGTHAHPLTRISDREKKTYKEREKNAAAVSQYSGIYPAACLFSSSLFCFSLCCAFCFITAYRTEDGPTPLSPPSLLPYKDTCGTRGGGRERKRERDVWAKRSGEKGQPLEDQNRDSIEAKDDPNQNPRLTNFTNVYTDLFSVYNIIRTRHYYKKMKRDWKKDWKLYFHLFRLMYKKIMFFDDVSVKIWNNSIVFSSIFSPSAKLFKSFFDQRSAE